MPAWQLCTLAHHVHPSACPKQSDIHALGPPARCGWRSGVVGTKPGPTPKREALLAPVRCHDKL